MIEESPAIGIDLGTTYSCVASVKNDKVEIIHGEDGNRIMASCVTFKDNGQRVVGNQAKEQSFKNPLNSILGIKRFIGRTYDEFNKEKSHMKHLYEIINKNNKPTIVVDFYAKIREFSSEEISAMILEKLKGYAEEYLKQNVTKAVITVPAHFNDGQRQATKDAGTIAGLEVMRILNEPTAAALAYELHNKYEGKECNILVYDFGGGTFDVSIVARSEGILDVIATNGEPYLGGIDIDKQITQYLIKQFHAMHDIDLSKQRLAIRRLQHQAERAKIALSSSNTAYIGLDSLFSDKDFYTEISRAKFDEINMNIFEKTMKCVEQTLKDAKLNKDDIHEIVLVGGSTRIPRIREMVKIFSNNNVLNASLNPDEAVAIGAARQAAIINGETANNTHIKEILLYDVCSQSYGIETSGKLMDFIIPRNTKIPTEISKQYTTTEDNQTKMRIAVYEGENKYIDENKKLGEFAFNGLKLGPRGSVTIDVIFNIDTNGILNISASERGSQNTRNITVESNKGYLSKSDITKMMAQAEYFREEDKKRKANIKSQIVLQNYCFDTLSILSELNISEENKNLILNKCEETLETLEENLEAVDCVSKKSELYKMFEPIIRLNN